MRPGEKSVLLVSNAPSTTGQDNTLTSFSGSIPTEFLNKHTSWKVAVDGCGLHMMLKQPISSKYENYPSLIQITYPNLHKTMKKHLVRDMTKLKLSMLENGLKLFVNREKSYTSQSLAKDFEQQATFYRTHHEGSDGFDGVPFKYDEESKTIKFGRFESDSSEIMSKQDREYRTCVFINKRFNDGLKIQFSSHENRITDIGGELYHYFYNTRLLEQEPLYPFKSLEKDFPLKKPEIIQITSSDIEHNANSDKFCRSLTQFTIKQSEINTYTHKEFKNHEFSDVLSNCITRFGIKFVDENLNQLHLSRGLPSWVKLVFSSRMEHKRNVIISSEPSELHPENNISDFCVELTQPIDFSLRDDPRVALTRVSFKNKWKLMPGLKLNIFIFYCKTQAYYTYECPKDIRGCEGIIEWCKNILKKKLLVDVVNEAHGNLSIKFPEGEYIIILGRDLAQCMGLSYSHEDLFINVKKNDLETEEEEEEEEEKDIPSTVQNAIDKYIFNRYKVTSRELPFKPTGDVAIYSSSKSTLHLDFPPRNIEIYPNELYIFLNIVKPWPVIGENRELLKIVPIKQDENNENITVDFDRLEYHSLSELHPRLLKFKIATVDGALIEPFDKNYNIYMNLQFCYN